MSAAPGRRAHWALAAVLLLHGAALWALQQGLLQRAPDLVAPAALLVEIMLSEPAPTRLPATRPKPERAEATRTTEPVKPLPTQLKPIPTPPQTQQSPEPAPLAAAAALPPLLPAPQSTAATPASPAAINTTSATTRVATNAIPAPGTTSPQSAPAPAWQQPSIDADYLNNPRPSYPAMSRRLGEQGKVLVHTLIGADGVPQKAEILHSSGFQRLDRAALETALKWRYVPGKRGGVPEAMWFNVPLHFVLD